jgi:hypothetical protein
MIPKPQIKNFLEIVRDDIWYSRSLSKPEKIDCTFTLAEIIPASCLIDHKHPASIPRLPSDF